MSDDDDMRELMKSVARKRMLSSHNFDRYMRAEEVLVPDETPDERKQRLVAIHWALFDAPPPFDPNAQRPWQQQELPLDEEACRFDES